MQDLQQIFTFLFLMLGPFKIIGPFAKMTQQATPQLVRQLATRAILFSILAVLIAAVMGEKMLGNFGIPIPVLALAGGLILFLVALSNVIQQFDPPENHLEQPAPNLMMALSPLAFPTIITPYGIAAVIVFMIISPDLNTQLKIGAMVIGIMLLNLVVMLLTRHIGKFLFLFLSIVGSVLGVIQVALGLMIIINQVKTIFGLV
ncbi:MAG: MarC family protein [Saprospiraceae bacterium]|nr:MarC family protein [Candidatus Opimibacter iunctus]